MKEFETLRFVNNAKGQQEKSVSLQALSKEGWQIASETIESGQMKGQEACCLGAICLPMAFLAGRTPSVISVNVSRDVPAVPADAALEPHEHNWRLLDANRAICSICGIRRAR